ncbi:MAG: hypothetical protein NXI17_04075 [Alphaproteobacteria bacterium]|nr:hypothetical protein [Alphaproteobacteria bacterium]
MSPVAGQMSFDLPIASAMTREDFILDGANQKAFDMIVSWPDWPTDVIVLAGPVGSGKSHLAAIHSQQSGAKLLNNDELPKPEDLPVLGSTPVIVEDAYAVQLDETRMFHLLNHVRERASTLLITSRSWPDSWPLTLPDLRSRLRAAHPLELNEPGDQLLRQVMVKLFADRQLTIEPRVLEYILVRMERSLSAAGRLVTDLDRLSLEQGRPITRQLAADVL